MPAVKGSKQRQMVVVPHRPVYRLMIFMGFVAFTLVFSWFSYEYGKYEGTELKVEVIRERDQISEQLSDSQGLIAAMRQEIADLKIGGQIDEKANEEVRYTIESLQDEIAQLNEEINFYKGVMIPNVGNKGLRIERLDMSSNIAGRIKYSLLLTQVVDKHDYVQGNVVVSVHGQAGEEEKTYQLNELDSEQQASVRFRFRYFQNISGEMVLPQGFVPREILIVARSTGSNSQRLERSFDWSLNGG
jgi:hypothetical protein